MSDNNKYLKEKLAAILPKENQFTIELKLQIILKLQKDENYRMEERDYHDIYQYCYDIINILDNLTAGESFINGILCYEMAKAKIKITEKKIAKMEHVSLK